MVWELQDQRDAAEASRAQVEAGAERKGAQAKESHAPPSSQTHLMQQSSSENAARPLEHQPEQQRTFAFHLTWTSDRMEQEERVYLWGEEEEEERACFWKELGHDEQWWNSMVVAEPGVAEKQPQESPPPAWPDEDDGVGGKQPISSLPRGALSGTHLTFSCRTVIDGMHRQAGDAQRGRIFQTVDAQEVGEHENWESRRLGGGLRFGFFAGPGEEHGQRGRRCPLRERLREKAKIIACRKRTC